MGATNAYVGTMSRVAGGQQVSAATLATDAAIGAAGPVAGKLMATGARHAGNALAKAQAKAVAHRAPPVNGEWPPNQGFAGQRLPAPSMLRAGATVDRFGSEGGSFVAEAGTPFAGRSLPPGHAFTQFTTYGVVKDIPAVVQGPAAPWFWQPGGGTQFMLNESVESLVHQGYLIRNPPVRGVSEGVQSAVASRSEGRGRD